MSNPIFTQIGGKSLFDESQTPTKSRGRPRLPADLKKAKKQRPYSHQYYIEHKDRIAESNRKYRSKLQSAAKALSSQTQDDQSSK